MAIFRGSECGVVFSGFTERRDGMLIEFLLWWNHCYHGSETTITPQPDYEDVSFNLRLQSATVVDLMRVREWIDSPSELLQWAGPMFSYPLDETQARDHLAVTTQSQPTRRAFTVRDATERLVGYLELDRIDRQNRTASVSRVIVAPDARGEGYGTAMVRRVLEVGFEEIDLHRVGLRVFDFNDAALACYERVGFTREGPLRDVRRHDDEYWTLVQMSILEDEWASGLSARK